MEKTWTVVKFIDEDSVEAVPTSWILGNRCHWPPFTHQKIIAAIKNYEVPISCWPTHEISFFRNGTFDNYLEARQKCKIAESQSDLLSEVDDKKNRKIRNKKPVSSSDSSSDEEELLPDPPQIKVNSLKMNEKKSASLNEIIQENNNFSSSSTLLTSDDAVLKQLVTDFENFSIQCIRKQNMLTTIVTDILSEVKSLKNTIAELRGHQADSTQTESIFEKLWLPARNNDQLTEIENYLMVQDNFIKAESEMSRIGGNSPSDFVKRCMLQLMTYEMATLYTWFGTKKKSAFKETRMSQLLLRASKGIGNIKQVEEALQNFFRRAKERSQAKEGQHREA